jgi:phosphoribosylformimino-5-aminoimidazole carboxamide ribotide isomerase
MRIMPVLDLQGGQVVHAVAGQRWRYRPVQSIFARDARPETVAQALVAHFGFTEVYVADLDAIAGGEPDWPTWEGIAAAGLTLVLDAGVNSVTRARQLASRPNTAAWLRGIVLGLESVVSPDLVPACLEILGSRRAVFSLDLKQRQPLTSVPAWQMLTAETIANLAVDAGFSRLIVLDLARVGGSAGTGLEALCQGLRTQHPQLELIAGGGVGGIEDLQNLAAAGCDAALVASVLHDGRLTRAQAGQVLGERRREISHELLTAGNG